MHLKHFRIIIDIHKQLYNNFPVLAIQNYDFKGSNRLQVQTIFDAGEGHFHMVGNDPIKRMIRERYIISPEVADDIASEMIAAKEFAGVPVKDGYIFDDWTTNEQQMDTNNNVKNVKKVKNDYDSLNHRDSHSRREQIKIKSQQVLKEIEDESKH